MNEPNRLARARRRESGRSLREKELPSVADHAMAVDDAETVAAALKRLDPADRELVDLKIYGDLTFREIAYLIKMPQGTVATRYRRALHKLRGWLARQLR